MPAKTTSTAIFSLAFTALIVAIHAPYLKMPLFWDELGQFVPAALDIFQRNAWIPQTTLPNVHPPGVMAYLALVWSVFGYSIPATRLAMLIVASAGALFAFLLAIRLSRGTAGAPAFAALIFLIASPIFYAQSMLAQLDMPAMTLTALALLLFLEERFAASALASTVLVLVKETSISTPLVFAAWLWFHDRRRREALYFLAPAIGLGAWLFMLHRATGYWLGNADFGRYNVSDSIQPVHLLRAAARRIYFLFLADGRFLGTLALFAGWRVLRGREWTIAFLVSGAQLLVVTVFGGAALDRYVLPLFPVLYAAMAAAASVYRPRWRWITQPAMAALMVVAWFWTPPLVPFENNLAMTDFVNLQQEAASYLEAYAIDKRIASAWPLTDEIERPEFGYVQSKLVVTARAEDFSLTNLADLDRSKIDVLVVFPRAMPLDGGAFDYNFVRDTLHRVWGYEPPASAEQIKAGLGFTRVARWTRRGQWIEMYLPEL